MEVSASLNYSRITPRKLKLVTDSCKGLSVLEASRRLTLQNKKGSKIVYKLLNSAIANAKNKGSIASDMLYVKNIFVDNGPIMKRIMPRSMGRAFRILKRMSHVTIVLDEVR